MATDESRLREAFLKASEGTSITAHATFQPFKEFKTSWSKMGDSAEFKVTDYMRGAPQNVLEEFAAHLVPRVGATKSHRAKYTEDIRTCLLYTSPSPRDS